MTNPATGTLRGLLQKLSGRQLFWFILTLFLFDLILPDPIPFVDELFLAALTVATGMLQLGRRDRVEEVGKPAEKNVTPPAGDPADGGLRGGQ